MAKSVHEKKKRVAHNTSSFDASEMLPAFQDILSDIMNGMDTNTTSVYRPNNNSSQKTVKTKIILPPPAPKKFVTSRCKKFGLCRKFPLMEKSQRALKQIKHNQKLPKPRAHLAGLSPPRNDSVSINPPVLTEKLKKNKSTTVKVNKKSENKNVISVCNGNSGVNPRNISNKLGHSDDPKSKNISKKQKLLPEKKNAIENSHFVEDDITESDSESEYEKFIKRNKNDLKYSKDQKRKSQKPKQMPFKKKKSNKKRVLNSISDSEEEDTLCYKNKRRKKTRASLDNNLSDSSNDSDLDMDTNMFDASSESDDVSCNSSSNQLSGQSNNEFNHNDKTDFDAPSESGVDDTSCNSNSSNNQLSGQSNNKCSPTAKNTFDVLNKYSQQNLRIQPFHTSSVAENDFTLNNSELVNRSALENLKSQSFNTHRSSKHTLEINKSGQENFKTQLPVACSTTKNICSPTVQNDFDVLNKYSQQNLQIQSFDTSSVAKNNFTLNNSEVLNRSVLENLKSQSFDTHIASKNKLEINKSSQIKFKTQLPATCSTTKNICSPTVQNDLDVLNKYSQQNHPFDTSSVAKNDFTLNNSEVLNRSVLENLKSQSFDTHTAAKNKSEISKSSQEKFKTQLSATCPVTKDNSIVMNNFGENPGTQSFGTCFATKNDTEINTSRPKNFKVHSSTTCPIIKDTINKPNHLNSDELIVDLTESDNECDNGKIPSSCQPDIAPDSEESDIEVVDVIVPRDLSKNNSTKNAKFNSTISVKVENVKETPIKPSTELKTLVPNTYEVVYSTDVCNKYQEKADTNHNILKELHMNNEKLAKDIINSDIPNSKLKVKKEPIDSEIVLNAAPEDKPLNGLQSCNNSKLNPRSLSPVTFQCLMQKIAALKEEFNTYQEIIHTEESVEATFKLLEKHQAEKLKSRKSEIKQILESLNITESDLGKSINVMLNTSESESSESVKDSDKTIASSNANSSKDFEHSRVQDDITLEDLKTFSAMNIVPLSSIPESDIKPDLSKLQLTVKQELPSSLNEVNTLSLSEKCIVCDQDATATCQQCAEVFFCSHRCAQKFWERGHKDTCGK